MLSWEEGCGIPTPNLFSAGDKFSSKSPPRPPGGAPRCVWGLGVELGVFTFDVLNCIFLQWQEEQHF